MPSAKEMKKAWRRAEQERVKPSDADVAAMFGPRDIRLPDGTVRRWVPEGPIIEIASKNGKMVTREIAVKPKDEEVSDGGDIDGH